MNKKIIYILIAGFLFLYGFSIGFYKVFPFRQLMALKHYIEYSTDTFESGQRKPADINVEVYETFLQRLLVKKIPIPGFSGHGGGLSVSGNKLYLITNKGAVLVYNIDQYSAVKGDISNVPVNFGDLIQSGHTYKNDFRINWFRVNGVFSEEKTDTTHVLFASHNAYNETEDCITQNISRTELITSNGQISQLEDWKTIFTASPCINPVPEIFKASVPYPGHISGGIIQNYDERNLLVSIGDYNRHGIGGTDEYAMNPNNPYGKLILVNKNSGEWSIFAMGSRNASGLYLDKESVIWSVENGPEGGDELNIILEGENYGWPKVSYGLWYDHSFELPGNTKPGTHPNYKKPVFSWVPSVAPRGITKIEGNKFKLWTGDLLIGTMRDRSLHRLRLNEEDQVVYDERINIDHRIRDLLILPNDRIALLTDDGFLIVIDDGGTIFQDINSDIVSRMAELENFDRFNTESNNAQVNGFENTSESIYQQNCATCHNLVPKNQIGPHLDDLFNREIGGLDNFNYSNTLKNDTRTWNIELLKSFLQNPEEEFSGNRMPGTNLSANEVDSLIQFLKNQ